MYTGWVGRRLGSSGNNNDVDKQRNAGSAIRAITTSLRCYHHPLFRCAGELIRRKPLFAGSDYMDQLRLITATIGAKIPAADAHHSCRRLTLRDLFGMQDPAAARVASTAVTTQPQLTNHAVLYHVPFSAGSPDEADLRSFVRSERALAFMGKHAGEGDG